MKKLTKEELTELRKRYESANYQTVISLFDHIEALEEEIDQDTFCAFCGMKYPKGTPKHRNELLSNHIKECPEHPMRIAEKRIQSLRNIIIESIHAIHGNVEEHCEDTKLSLLPDALKKIQEHWSDLVKSMGKAEFVPFFAVPTNSEQQKVSCVCTHHSVDLTKPEFQFAQVTQTNVDRMPVDFTVNGGNVNIMADCMAHKLWLCINGQAAVRIRGYETLTEDMINEIPVKESEDD
jgi:hypothetical protein